MTAPVVGKLRTDMVLKISDTVQAEGRVWYKIVFDEWLRYPERVSGEWYVAAEYVTLVHDVGEKSLVDSDATTTKRIVVDRSEQTLVAYDGEDIFLEAVISTGLELTPTPRGEFTVFKKVPSRYMQGPLPYLKTSDFYDLPGVPWNLYFTEQGAIIHGAYWHDNFGIPYSHGCVNMKPEEAQRLYEWADLGSKVVVQD